MRFGAKCRRQKQAVRFAVHSQNPELGTTLSAATRRVTNFYWGPKPVGTLQRNTAQCSRNMKVKVINRSEEDYTRERSQDLRKVHKNLDPKLHPFEKAVEYTRALNAAKLDRVFAKPFLASLAHDDGITCLARNPRRLNSLVAGCADGELR